MKKLALVALVLAAAWLSPAHTAEVLDPEDLLEVCSERYLPDVKGARQDRVGYKHCMGQAQIIAALKKRFPDIIEDSVETGVGGFKCRVRGCSLVWFETREALWECNFTFADRVKIINCWNRHA